ncbi:MAG: putative ester cyclase [Frankiales bacterium]|nr:putative ester cyclase [Frankiales bacterium]
MSDHATTISRAVALLNQGDVRGYATALYAPGARFHGFPEAFPPDRDGIIAFFTALIAAVPDAAITPRDMLVDGDKVAVRFALTGTHHGELLGAAGTGGALDVDGMTILHFEGESCTERWNQLDDVTLIAQLHAAPALVAH